VRRNKSWHRRGGALLLGGVLALWTLVPIYNLLLIALRDDAEEFSRTLWPSQPSFEGFAAIWEQDHWYLEYFWRQFGNSIYIGFSTMVLTVALSSLASFAIGRLRPPRGPLLGLLSLLIYAVPPSLLVIPFTRLMAIYGLTNSLWAVIAAQVVFATPFAILIVHKYGKLIPMDLDDAARIDGAGPLRIYLWIYVPLAAPALAAVATFALLLAWNDYQYQFLLLSSTRSTTVAVALDQFFDSDEAPWNYMMSIALIYALPPIAVYYALRRYMIRGLTMGGVKE
jgi:multiple sugar transport system permease protein